MSRWWKVLVVVLLMLSLLTTWLQLNSLQRFMNQGPRFTAKDGQELCERVRALETVSYGYLNTGKKPLTCNYFKEK